MPSKTRHAKRTPPEHLVVVDSSVLWHSDKSHVVSPEFEPLWLELGEIADLTLGIPAVVRGELLYQHTTSALRTLARMQDELGKLSATTGAKQRSLATEQVVRDQVQARLDTWIARLNYRVLPTPIQSIDWAAIVDGAVWRTPPFTQDKSADVEKGFRDAMILETVVSTLGLTAVPRIAFICGDKLLARATSERSGAEPRFSVHDSMTAFGSSLRLAQETLTDQFVKSIVAHATTFFFERGASGTLYYAASVKDRIEKEFSQSLEVNELGAGLLHSIAPERTHSAWRPIGQRRVRIGTAQFLRIDDSERFHWRSPITLVRAFERQRPENTFARAFGHYEQNLLTVRVDVNWSADVSAAGKFSNGSVGAIAQGSRQFKVATLDLIEKYDLRVARRPGLFD